MAEVVSPPPPPPENQRKVIYRELQGRAVFLVACSFHFQWGAGTNSWFKHSSSNQWVILYMLQNPNVGEWP